MITELYEQKTTVQYVCSYYADLKMNVTTIVVKEYTNIRPLLFENGSYPFVVVFNWKSYSKNTNTHSGNDTPFEVRFPIMFFFRIRLGDFPISFALCFVELAAVFDRIIIIIRIHAHRANWLSACIHYYDFSNSIELVRKKRAMCRVLRNKLMRLMKMSVHVHMSTSGNLSKISHRRRFASSRLYAHFVPAKIIKADYGDPNRRFRYSRALRVSRSYWFSRKLCRVMIIATAFFDFGWFSPIPLPPDSFYWTKRV